MAEVKTGTRRGPPASLPHHPHLQPPECGMERKAGYGVAGVGVGSVEEELRVAAGKGQTDMVRQLLDMGARLDTDDEGRTALHYAAHNGHPDMCRLLLHHGCPLDLQDSGGYTAVQRACSQGQLDALEVCLQGGCSVNIPDQHGNTALHEAAWHGFSQSVELLLQYNANVFITNTSGFTALHLAAQSGHNESSRVLLYGGMDPDQHNNYGDTALHTAARYGHAGVTRILISGKCQLNLQNKNGDTALHIAAALKRRKIAKILVESHADIHVLNKQNDSAVDVARRKDNQEVVLIINSLARVHGGGVTRGREGVAVTFREEVDTEGEGLEEEGGGGPYKGDVTGRPEKERAGFFAFFKKKRKSQDKDGGSKEKVGGWKQTTTTKKPTTTTNSSAASHGLPPPPLTSGVAPPHPLVPVRRVSGFFSHYVPRTGTQYYRDLAGNIKQGPVGYSPVCQCRPVLQQIEQTMQDATDKFYDHIHTSHQVLEERIRQLDAAPLHPDPATQQRLEAERGACQSALQLRLRQERQRAQQLLQSFGAELHSQVETWLEERLSTYGHCLDHHHDDSALPPTSVFNPLSQHGLPPARLFRSRSDETLSASDNSGRGGGRRKREFYASRKAAMEQIRGWKVPDREAPGGGEGGGRRRREGGQSVETLDRRQDSDDDDDDGGGGRLITVAADVHRSSDRLADRAAPSALALDGDGRREGGVERWGDASHRQRVQGLAHGGRHSPALTGLAPSFQQPPHHPPPRQPPHHLHGHPYPRQTGSHQWDAAAVTADCGGPIPPDAQHGVPPAAARDPATAGSQRPSPSWVPQHQHRGRGEMGRGWGVEGGGAIPRRSLSPSRTQGRDRGGGGQQSRPVHPTPLPPQHPTPLPPQHHRYSLHSPLHEDGPRALSGTTEGAAEGAGARQRSRSEERVLESSPARQQRHRDDHSGYMTDSAARVAPLPRANYSHVPSGPGWRDFRTAPSSSRPAALRTEPAHSGADRSQMSRGRTGGMQSSRRDRPPHVSSERLGVGEEGAEVGQQGQTSQWAQTQGRSQPLSHTAAYGAVTGGTARQHNAYDRAARPKTPTDGSAYGRLLGRAGDTLPAGTANSGVVNSTEGTAHYRALYDRARPKTPAEMDSPRYTNGRVDKLPADTQSSSAGVQSGAQGAAYYGRAQSPRVPGDHGGEDGVPMQHFSTFKPLSEQVVLQDTQHFSTFKPLSEQVVLQDTRRASRPFNPTPGPWERGAQAPGPSSTAADSARHDGQPSAGRPRHTHAASGPQSSLDIIQDQDPSSPAQPAVSSGHYSVRSATCLRYRTGLSPYSPAVDHPDSTVDHPESPVDHPDSKEHSTCSSNQDSGYSSRMMTSSQPGAEWRRGGDSATTATTPSSSFSTDRSLSASTPPSTAGSPYIHVAGRSFAEDSAGPASSRGHGLPDSVHPPPSDRQSAEGRRAADHGADRQGLDLGAWASGPSRSTSVQQHVQGWYQTKLLEAAQRLRHSQRYGQAGDCSDPTVHSTATAAPAHLRFDPVHGSDV